MLSAFGFGTILVLMIVLRKKWMSPVVALALIPTISCILAGQAKDLGSYIATGVKGVATNGIIFIFAVCFFGILTDAGVFDPLVNGIIKLTKGDVVKVFIGTYLITMVGHLDGAGATTIMIVVPAMLPIYKKLNINKLLMCIPMCIAIGVENIFPWGGPPLRAATVLEMDLIELWLPLIPVQIIGLIVGLIIVIFVGKKEKSRLQAAGQLVDGMTCIKDSQHRTPEQVALLRPKMLLVNWLLIIVVMLLMCLSILPTVAAFMIGAGCSLLFNYRDTNLQKKLITEHGTDAIYMSAILFSAGVLIGVLNQSGMATAMAETMIALVPASMSGLLAPIVAFVSAPLSLLFDPDTIYYGIMPVLVETAESVGVPGVAIGRALLMGSATLGTMLSPLVGAAYMQSGMLGVDLVDEQRVCFKWCWLVSICMGAACMVLGLFA